MQRPLDYAFYKRMGCVKFIPGQPMWGWLQLYSGGWQRKFFVLNGCSFYHVIREDEITLKFAYPLHEYTVRDLPNNPEEPDKFAFVLVKVMDNWLDTTMLCATSEFEKKEWLRGLCFQICAAKGGAIFSIHLEEVMKFEHKQGRSVPYIVEACVTHLENNNAMETEGIFRLAGSEGLLQKLRCQFEKGQRPPLDSIDAHTVGSLLKAYLRELPQSLVPPELFQRAMNCALRYSSASSEEGRKVEVGYLASIMQELPNINYATLAYICRFLNRLAANKTKRTAQNLALDFGPNLIRHLDTSPMQLMATADLTPKLAFLLISHTPEVLPPMPERESVPTD